MNALQTLEEIHTLCVRQLGAPEQGDTAMLIKIATVINNFADNYNLPEAKTCVDITAEKLTRFVEGQAPWDPRGELMFFEHKETPDHVMWLSRYRIGIHALSVNGVGVTKGDKYRLSLRNRHEDRKAHRRWNATKATQANSKA